MLENKNRPSKGKKGSQGDASKAPAKSKDREPKAAREIGSDGRFANGFPVVGIGASAGGLEALETLLRRLPSDSGMAFVIVTHQHPGHTSLLPDLLAKCTPIPVVEATDGVRIAPNHVYVAPPGANLEILNRRLRLTKTKDGEPSRLPIDFFLRSLAQDQKERAICIILSGTGTDGTLGIRAIKGESGMVMVQEVKSAKYAGMPSSALATGLVDYVLAPQEMPRDLITYALGPYLAGERPSPHVPPVPFEPIQKIFSLLRTRTGHDFSSYKMSTVGRRIERRMNVHQIKDAGSFLRFLQENPHEIDILFQELLISVTSFFRDAHAYEALAEKALPKLLRSRPEGSTLRVWVPGCSTGEEAYSIAMLLREAMEKLKRHFEIQIFATDLDNSAIGMARSGIYPDGIAVDVSRERLEPFFVREDGGYRVRKELRETVIFAPQNVISDPPFTKLDLLSCRNLLIYLDGAAQRRLLPMFHYALRPGGILFLGPSETVGSFTELFSCLDNKWKVFLRKDVPSPPHPLLDFPGEALTRQLKQADAAAAEQAKATSMPLLVERLLLARFAPASVVTNDRGDIVYIHGRTGSLLEPVAGRPRLNVLEMAREGLQPALSAAMREALGGTGEVRREKIRVKGDGATLYVNVSASKLREPENLRGLLLISFHPFEPPHAAAKEKKGGMSSLQATRVQEIEHELQYAKESLRTTVEELETSNDELKSANEELQSMNEELQSTNEEMETSKEEMQSLNAELTTVNVELQLKVDDLGRANDDMQNLLNSTEVATIFLDNQLRIKRYTEHATTLIKLIPTDIGRPLGDLVSNLKTTDLLADAAAVLRTLTRHETEVQRNDGHWYLMRMVPYRTAENVIDGLVLTFVDIDRVKKAETSGAEGKRYFEGIFDALQHPTIVLDSELHVVSVNSAFCKTFQVKPKRAQGEHFAELGNGQWEDRELKRLLERAVKAKATFERFRIERDLPEIGRRTLELYGRPIARGDSHTWVLLEVQDVGEAAPP